MASKKPSANTKRRIAGRRAREHAKLKGGEGTNGKVKKLVQWRTMLLGNKKSKMLRARKKLGVKAKGPDGAKPRRNFLIRAFKFVMGIILRILWWIFFRVAIVTAAVVGSATTYYYSTLPDAVALMDDRKRGSITILDQTGQVFAWRGDQFGGLVDANSVAPHLRDAVV
ncbi:MAG: hypothetical protein P8O69_05515, partial [Amylibacter sp.]|nr:hypothetical protein [Amylibacter sp.]